MSISEVSVIPRPGLWGSCSSNSVPHPYNHDFFPSSLHVHWWVYLKQNYQFQCSGFVSGCYLLLSNVVQVMVNWTKEFLWFKFEIVFIFFVNVVVHHYYHWMLYGECVVIIPMVWCDRTLGKRFFRVWHLPNNGDFVEI